MTPLRTDNLVQWQKVDTETNAVFPWFTHPFLDVLKTWNLKGKRILEFGGGRSTRWWRSKAAWVTTIDTNPQWANQIERDCAGLDNGVLLSRQINEGDQSRSQEYVNMGDQYGPYDIVIVDGILRHECVLKALTLPRPLIIIHDNYQQDGFVCPATAEVMAPYQLNNFIQSNHTDHNGNPWSTAYWRVE